MQFTVIIPVYNRPDEMKELLDSLKKQTLKCFDVVIVEDGSRDDMKCENLIDDYKNDFHITYHYKPNTGQSDSRNIGMSMAKGDYFIFFDSDCIIPKDYMKSVSEYLSEHYIDAFGGPDAAHPSFNNLQKAISHSMTSFFTTGGIRGGKKSAEKFCPRSFNMGFSRAVYNATGGFRDTLGEDIDLSTRIRKAGFETGLISHAYVYHKRRVSLTKFFKQVHIFGQARISLYKQHPESLKIVHLAPAVFTLGFIGIILLSFAWPPLLLLLAFYFLIIFIDSSIKNRSVVIGALSIITGFIQLFGDRKSVV